MGLQILEPTKVRHMIVVRTEDKVEDDYDLVESKSRVVESSYSLIRSRTNGVIRVKRLAPIRHLADFIDLAHPDIVQICAVYRALPDFVIVEEYLEVRLVDLMQLTEMEIASATSQIIGGFRHLSDSLLEVEIDDIRVSLAGRAKIVVLPGQIWSQAKVGIKEYWRATFESIFHSMLPKRNGAPFVSYLAHHFLRTSANCIPTSEHKFLQLSEGRYGLVSRVKRCRLSGI